MRKQYDEQVAALCRAHPRQADALATLADGVPEDSPDRLLLDVVTGLLERAEKAAGSRYPATWRRFLAAFPDVARSTAGLKESAVLASLTALLALDEPVDHLRLHHLVKRLGHRRLAPLQARLARLLEPDDRLPATTALIRGLARHERIARGLTDEGLPAEEARSASLSCYRAAFWLLMAEVPDAVPGEPLTTPEEMKQAVEGETVVGWREQFALVAADPWAPYPIRVRRLAADAGYPEVAEAFERCMQVYRTQLEVEERRQVAREIRRLVAVSGASQREFARYVGTSPSRLSTYVTGTVTPSAVMLMRIARVSRMLEQELSRGG